MQFQEFVLGAPQIPDDAIEFAATLLIDTLGVAAGAVTQDAGRIARDHAARFHAAGRKDDAAHLLFDGRPCSLTGASFAMASQIDNLDAHDGLNPTKGHIGCAVVPTLCALAEHAPHLRGRDALRAMVIAYETCARAAIALHATVSDYHTSGAWNAVGVAAMGARLRALSPNALRQAIGIAEYHGPRSQMMREIANPTMLHDGSGMGALVGMMAVVLAEDGFQGAPAITVEAEEVAHIWADLGQRWTVTENYIKPYPICRWAHAPLDALNHVLRENSLGADQIARVDIQTFAQAAALYPGVPGTSSQAQYSLPFAIATQLVHGQIGPAHINGTGLTDAAVIAEMSKINVVEDPRFSAMFPAARCSSVTVTLTNGHEIASGDIHARGGPEAPLTLSEIEAKFHLMSAVLPQTRRDAIWAMRRALLDDAPFSDLLKLLHPPV